VIAEAMKHSFKPRGGGLKVFFCPALDCEPPSPLMSGGHADVILLFTGELINRHARKTANDEA
jgi:hypothetical protein